VSTIKLSTIVAFALKNAVEHEGTASPRAVIPKVFSGIRIEMLNDSALALFGDDIETDKRDVTALVERVVNKVNSLSLTEQVELMGSFSFEGKKEAREKGSLPLLPRAERGRVVTRFPPEPNGYLHIGHAKAAFIDYAYAREYDGRFQLRFDDTNPLKEDAVYYEEQRKDLRALGIEWDEELCTSDDLELLYDYCEEMIERGGAYVCTCNEEEIKRNRSAGVECRCRARNIEEDLGLWEEMLAGTKAIVRLKGDMISQNTAFRDPTMFRVIEATHPRQGSRYRVWPTYDFAGAIEDSIHGVTHAFRSKEYELRDEVYFRVLEVLNLRKPILMEFSRLELENMPVSKRVLKPLIEQREVEGWDDIRLPTIRGLIRRGFLPEAIREFVLNLGFSKNESMPSIGILEAMNRKLLDPVAKRYFFVPDPIELVVRDAPELMVDLKLHPEKDVGYRRVETNGHFFVNREDVSEGEEIRLKDLYNIRIDARDDKVHAAFVSREMKGNERKIQWVTEDSYEVEIIKSNGLLKDDKVLPLERIRGLLEEAGRGIKESEVVQFERFGFCRKDNEGRFCYTHR
jgi:glutamyl-tRNA synthetase